MRRRLSLELDAPPTKVQAALEASPEPDADPDGTLTTRLTPTGNGTTLEIVVTTDIRVPYFGWFFHPLIRRELRRRALHVAATVTAIVEGSDVPPPFRSSRLLPPATFSNDQIRFVATAAALAALANFGGALVGQYGAPMAESFGASDARLSVGLAVTRVGVLVALFTAALADRRGRRLLVLVGFVGVAIANALSALAPTFWLFIGPQVLTRALATATIVVAGIAVIEQAPERARAYSLALMSLAAGAGFALAVVLLPLADLSTQGWRLPFVVSAATLLVVRPLARSFAESPRYEALAQRKTQRGRVGEVVDRHYGLRFLALVLAAFLTNVFSAPSAQLANRYLIEEHDFSNTMVAVFRGVTSGLPGLLGIVVAGYLAERQGRRPLAVVALVIATVFQMVFFLGGGPIIWVAATASILAAASAGIAIATYNSELFPTEVRGTSNGLLVVSGVMGSLTGLLLAGNLGGFTGIGLGAAIAVCGIAPLLAACFVLPWLPETKDRALDTVSPSEV